MSEAYEEELQNIRYELEREKILEARQRQIDEEYSYGRD